MTTKQDYLNLITYILLSSIIALITLNIIKSKHKTTPTKKEYLHYNTNTIYNLTNNNKLDTIILIALKTYQIKNINVGLTYLNPKSNYNGITKHIDKNNYLIAIQKTNINNSTKIIAHEITHIKQLYYKEIIITHNKVIWKNKDITNNIPYYSLRPWEIEAYHKEDSINNIINQIINK